jgi:hypothetical protein
VRRRQSLQVSIMQHRELTRSGFDPIGRVPMWVEISSSMNSLPISISIIGFFFLRLSDWLALELILFQLKRVRHIVVGLA